MADYISVTLDQLFLDDHNPRFDPTRSEKDAIAKLCETEHIVEIAADIVSQGRLNPLDLIGVTLDKPARGRRKATYVVREGNRRVAAMKLVQDPSLAPQKLQQSFRALNASALPAQIRIYAADNVEDLKHWINLLHVKENPAGRSGWDTSAQGRSSGKGRAKRVYDMREVILGKGWANPEDLSGTGSVIERFMANKSFKDHAGYVYEGKNKDELRILDESVFDREIEALVRDVVAKKITTRSHNRATDLQSWVQDRIAAGHPSALAGSAAGRTRAQPAGAAVATRTSRRRPAPARPSFPNLPHSDRTASELASLANATKLQLLYHSLCKVPLDGNSVLLTAGWWSFMESLCSYVRGNPSQPFKDYLSNDILKNTLGFSKDEAKNLRHAIDDLHDRGNSTKHSAQAGVLGEDHLRSIVETLEPVVVRLLQTANGSHAAGTPWL